jgi:hypothetical protein
LNGGERRTANGDGEEEQRTTKDSLALGFVFCFLFSLCRFFFLFSIFLSFTFLFLIIIGNDVVLGQNKRKKKQTIKPPVLENRRFTGFSGSGRFRAV